MARFRLGVTLEDLGRTDWVAWQLDTGIEVPMPESLCAVPRDSASQFVAR